MYESFPTESDKRDEIERLRKVERQVQRDIESLQSEFKLLHEPLKSLTEVESERRELSR